MQVTPLIARALLLALAAGFGAAPAIAQAPPTEAAADDAADTLPDADDKPAETDILKDIEVEKLDWSQLNIDASMLDLAPFKARAAAKGMADSGASWSSTA